MLKPMTTLWLMMLMMTTHGCINTFVPCLAFLAAANIGYADFDLPLAIDEITHSISEYLTFLRFRQHFLRYPLNSSQNDCRALTLYWKNSLEKSRLWWLSPVSSSLWMFFKNFRLFFDAVTIRNSSVPRVRLPDFLSGRNECVVPLVLYIFWYWSEQVQDAFVVFIVVNSGSA